MSDEVRQETAIHWRAYGDYEPVSPDDEDPQELIDQLPAWDGVLVTRTVRTSAWVPAASSPATGGEARGE